MNRTGDRQILFSRLGPTASRLGGTSALAAIAAALSLAVAGWCQAAEHNGVLPLGNLEADLHSAYSHIRLYRYHNVRTLAFVRDSGEEVLETQVDLAKPYELHFSYLQYLFLSYLFQPHAEHVAIVGLGGGSMIHFLQHYDPRVQIDAVEIDPLVVSIAQKYFAVRAGRNVNLITADALQYLSQAGPAYDVIYMDAFLKPSAGTDSTGAPLHLRTVQFYRQLQQRLRPQGLVGFNLNPRAGIDDDVSTIREAFPQVYVFDLPRGEGKVALASMVPQRQPVPLLREKAQQLDRRFHAEFSFQRMAGGG